MEKKTENNVRRCVNIYLDSFAQTEYNEGTITKEEVLALCEFTNSKPEWWHLELN